MAQLFWLYSIGPAPSPGKDYVGGRGLGVPFSDVRRPDRTLPEAQPGGALGVPSIWEQRQGDQEPKAILSCRVS